MQRIDCVSGRSEASLAELLRVAHFQLEGQPISPGCDPAVWKAIREEFELGCAPFATSFASNKGFLATSKAEARIAAVHFSELYPDVLPTYEQLDKLRCQTPRPLAARTDDLGGMFSLCLLAGQDTGAMAGDAVCFRGIWYVRNLSCVM